MIKKRDKSIFTLVLMLLVLSLASPIEATDLHFIDVDANLDKSGASHISMVWDYYDDEGTEHFLPINISGLELTNFKVSRNGQEYENIGEWDIDASFDEKAGKYGIVDYGDSYELCWGIGEYGDNEFTISYTLTGLIQNLEDAQAMNHQFINEDLGDSPDEISISISSYEPFSEEDIRMWAFGFEGQIFLEDGKVQARSTSALDPSNYANIMLKFPKDYFDNPQEPTRDQTFEDFRDIAFVGSDYEIYDEDGNIVVDEEIESVDQESSWELMGFIASMIGSVGLFILSIVKLNNLYSKDIEINPKDYKDHYYRDIPYDKDGQLEDIYFLLNQMKMSDHTDYINYYFLKWIRDGALEKTHYEKGVFFKKQKDGLKIIKEPEFDHELEERFFKFLGEAAGTDQMLEEDEFNKWMSKNSERFRSFIDGFNLHSEASLLDNDYLELEKRKVLFLTNRAPILTPSGRELTENLIKFKNYLYDFSLLNERDSINIHLWDELMLYAAIFGIAERVQKEFGKLAPEYFEVTNYDISAIQLSYLYSRSINNSYQSAMQASSFSASSGFGGGTSMGGGGGFTGGGSGGGTR